MKLAVNSLLSLLDVGTGFCYWLLGRDLVEAEIKRIKQLFYTVRKSDDEYILIDEIRNLSPGKDLLLVCDSNSHNLVQWCILHNYTQALIVLLEYGCNPSRSGLPDYDLPLALACCLGQRETIQLLLNHGAVPSQITMLSEKTLEYLAQQNDKDRYMKLYDLLKYRTSISPLSIVLTFDDLVTFQLLMGETDSTPNSSDLSHMLSPLINSGSTIEESHNKASDAEIDMICEKLKLKQYTDEILPQDTEDCMDKQQQNTVVHDDLSDYAEHGPFFSFCDTIDLESGVINHDDATQALSEKGNQVERINEEETCAIGATTDGGYCTVDGSSERVKSQPTIPPADVQTIRESSVHKAKVTLGSTDIEPISGPPTRIDIISRTKSHQQLCKSASSCLTTHRHSLPTNVFEPAKDQSSRRFRSTSSFLLSNMSNSSKHTAQLLRMLHQIIEHEAATILEYFLSRHRDEFNEHFHSAARSSDIQLKTYELLCNIKSDRIYKVLCSSNCAYFSTVTTSLCDRENNTLVHSLLGQNPMKYQPSEMIKMLERYMSCGLNEFINRPNLSNHCMIQILLCNEHFLKMIFFRHDFPSTAKYLNINSESYNEMVPFYETDLVEKWRQSYLILIEILIKYGARIDMPTGSFRNSLDGLLSSLIDLTKRFHSLPMTFDVKYLKRLISILFSSCNIPNTMKIRSPYFKYNFERFIQLICLIHIKNEDLSDILAIAHNLLHYECQPLRLNINTLLHLFKSWMINPNFLCSSLIGKNLFIQQFFTMIIRRLSPSTLSTNLHNDHPLILTTSNNLPRKSLTILDNDACLQSIFPMLMNLISSSPTCLQVHSIYELIVIFLNHTSIDTINSEHFQLPIIYLCSQAKVPHPTLLFPFIDLFTMVQTSNTIEKTKDILSQMSNKRLSPDLYKYFLSIEKSKTTTRSLRHIASRYLYHQLKRPFIDTVKILPIGDALKQRLIHFDDI